MKNNNDLNRHKKSDKIKWIAVSVAVILLAVMLTATITSGFKNWNPYGWLDKEEEQQTELNGVIDGDGNQMETGTVYAMPSKMSFTFAALASANGEGVTITLQATVLPVDAQNKAVDWGVEWNSGVTFGESPVTDFVTVTPQSDGSNIANVTCFKSFGSDTISIRVITRDGGFSALCVVSFVGHPSSFTIVSTGAQSHNDSGWGVPIVDIYSGKDYAFDFAFDNIFHSVDSGFVPNYTFEIIGIGQINLLHEKRNRGTIISSSTTAVNVSDSVSVMELNYTGGDSGETKDIAIQPVYFSASVEGGKLKINVNMSIAAFRFHVEGRYASETYSFNGYVDENKKPYYQIKVTETNLGLSDTINVRMESYVSSVSFDNPELTF